jgi:hypothetical protein
VKCISDIKVSTETTGKGCSATAVTDEHAWLRTWDADKE